MSHGVAQPPSCPQSQPPEQRQHGVDEIRQFVLVVDEGHLPLQTKPCTSRMTNSVATTTATDAKNAGLSRPGTCHSGDWVRAMRRASPECTFPAMASLNQRRVG